MRIIDWEKGKVGKPYASTLPVRKSKTFSSRLSADGWEHIEWLTEEYGFENNRDLLEFAINELTLQIALKDDPEFRSDIKYTEEEFEKLSNLNEEISELKKKVSKYKKRLEKGSELNVHISETNAITLELIARKLGVDSHSSINSKIQQDNQARWEIVKQENMDRMEYRMNLVKRIKKELLKSKDKGEKATMSIIEDFLLRESF